MNVLLLTADSLRPDRTSLFGHARDTTPFLSTLAGDAYEFRTAYANGHNTAASFPSIHCSTYASVFEGIGIPRRGHPTLAETLADHASLGITTNELLSREYNYDRGFEEYVDSRGDDGDGSTPLRAAARSLIGDGPLFELAKRLHFFSTETFGVKLFDTADAVSGFEERIVDRATAAADDWFVWAHYMNPHHPYEPPRDLQRELGTTPVSRREATKLSRKMRRHPERVTDDERETLRDLYDAEVLSFDREVESLLGRLDAADELADTLVAVTADHGELLGEDGLYGHPPVLRQGIVRVPLLFHGPVAAGVEERPVALLDLAPTVATLAGYDPPAAFRGTPLFDADGTPRPLDEEPIVAETADGRVVCCLDAERKVVYDVDGDAWTDYRIADDTFEEVAIDDSAADLRAALSDHLAWSERHRTSGAEIEQDRLEADLAALGYLEE